MLQLVELVSHFNHIRDPGEMIPAILASSEVAGKYYQCLI